MLFYRCCSNPKTCTHPKPTWEDWVALGHCYLRIYEKQIDAAVSGILMLLLFALMMFFWAITPDPFYG